MLFSFSYINGTNTRIINLTIPFKNFTVYANNEATTTSNQLNTYASIANKNATTRTADIAYFKNADGETITLSEFLSNYFNAIGNNSTITVTTSQQFFILTNEEWLPQYNTSSTLGTLFRYSYIENGITYYIYCLAGSTGTPTTFSTTSATTLTITLTYISVTITGSGVNCVFTDSTTLTNPSYLQPVNWSNLYLADILSFNAIDENLIDTLTVSIDGNNLSISISSDYKSATITGGSDYINSDSQIEITYTTQGSANIEITYNNTLTNCNVDYPAIITPGDYTFTITPNTNTQFSTTPRLIYLDIEYHFTINSDNTATLVVSITESGTIAITAVATIISYSGITGIFNPTYEQLSQLSNERYVYIGSNEGVNLIDLGSYICQLANTFAPITTTSETALKLGGHTLDITPLEVSETNIYFTSPDIVLTGLYGNIIDNSTTNSIKIILPFIGIYDLPTNYINQTLKIKYFINLLTSNVLVMLYINNNIVANLSGHCSNDIPFIFTDNVKISENCFIEHLQIIIEQNSKIDNYPISTNEKILLSEITSGFIQGQLTDFAGSSYILLPELEELEQLLTDGIVI